MTYRILVVVPEVTEYNQPTWKSLGESFRIQVVAERSATLKEIQWADVVLVGDLGHRSSLSSILMTRLLRKRLVIWMDEWVGRGILKDAAKSVLLRAASGYLACGIPQQARIAGLLGDEWTSKPCNIAPYFPHNIPTYDKEPQTGARRILFLARLVRDKGLATLYEAWKEVPGTISLTIAGDGNLKTWVAERFGDFDNVELRLRHIGVEERAALLLSHSVLISPSIFEPWGIIINEAMYAGVPVIASTAVASGVEMIKHGVNGWIFQVGNHKELRERILEAIQTNDETFQSMRSAAWEESRSRSLSVQVRQISDVLLKVVNAPSQRGGVFRG